MRFQVIFAYFFFFFESAFGSYTDLGTSKSTDTQTHIPTNQPTNQGACFKQRIRKRIHSDHQMIIFSSMEIKSVSWRESSDRFERHKQIQ